MPKKKSEVKSKKSVKIKKEKSNPIQQAIRSLIEEDIEVYEKDEVYSTIEGLVDETIPRLPIPPKGPLIYGIVDDLLESVDGSLEFDVEIDSLDVELVDPGFNESDVKKIVKSRVKKWVKEDPNGDWEKDDLDHPQEVQEILERIKSSPSSIFTKDDFIMLLQELEGFSKEMNKNPKIDENSIIEEIVDAITAAPIIITNFNLDVDGTSLVISDIEIDGDDLAQEIEGVLEDAPERGYFG